MASVKLLDTVALLVDRPADGLARGQLGTVVEQLAPDMWEVEFSDDEGRTYAMAAFVARDILVLRTAPVPA
jgi:hypothetical protein